MPMPDVKQNGTRKKYQKKKEQVPGVCVTQSDTEVFPDTSFSYQFRTRSILLPVLVSTPRALIGHCYCSHLLFYLPATNSSQILCCLLNSITYFIVISEANSSDRVYLSLFLSAMSISHSGNFATRKLVPETSRPIRSGSCTIFLNVCHGHNGKNYCLHRFQNVSVRLTSKKTNT